MTGSPSDAKKPSLPVKTHYEVLGLDQSAGAETIKKAFRREIAKYHPDKVIHLGQEFQEMAAVRAAELTIAYKTLTDDAQRAQYDQQLAEAGAQPPHRQTPDDLSEYEQPRQPPAAAAAAPQPPAPDYGAQDYGPPPPVNDARPGGRTFATERAGRDQILRRAMAVRVQGLMETLYGAVQTPKVRGFDIALVPSARPRFLGSPHPRVLVRVVDNADAAAVNDAGATASRARIHAPKSPLVVMLFAKHIAPQGELQKAFDALARQRKAPDGPDELSVVIVDVNDWSARLPPNVSAPVRKLVEQLRN